MMQICEFHQINSESHFKIFDGRWQLETREERADENLYWTTFEWTDLFGKEESV
jgi:hypothetical protein